MSKHQLNSALRALAEHQHGLVGRVQAYGVGATRRDLQRRERSGAWKALTSQVLRLAGSPETFQQRCLAAVLDAEHGAVASHRAAAALWGLPGFPTDVVEVSRLRAQTGRTTSLGIQHEVCLLPAHHVTDVQGIPVTTVGRTVFDLAGAVNPRRAERALDNALARQWTTLLAMARLTAELAEHGRAGSALMRELMEARGASYVPPESGLEARFHEVLRLAGEPVPERQVDLGGERWVGRVDHLYREEQLVVEVDSSIHHSSLLDRAADNRRDAELAKLGYSVLRIRDTDVWHRPDVVVAAVRNARQQARQRFLQLKRHGKRAV